MKKLFLILVAGACVAALAFVTTVTPIPAHAQNSEVPLYDDLGDYHYEISSSIELAQQYFDQGLRLYYAFNHAEAIRAFREAQQLDEQCAICWWGEALAWGPNINLPMDTPSAVAAYAAIEKAVSLQSNASAKEQALIDALSSRYKKGAPEQRASLDQAYAEAMATLATRFNGDIDVGVLYAEALMNLRPWDYWTTKGEPQVGIDIALSYLQKALTFNENHPGACHFYIHAVEAVYPKRAIDCAERLATLMPGAGHLVHMPGHIYIRVGRYLDAVLANEHAVHADETYIQDQHPSMGMYTAGYYPHNYDFMAFAAMMIGRSDTAIESAQKVTSLLPAEMYGSAGMDFLQHWSVRPLQMQVRFAKWQDILQVTSPAKEYPHAVAIWHYARGRAFLATGNLVAADNELSQLRTITARSDLDGLRMEFNQSRDLLRIAERVLTGWNYATAGSFDAALAALQEAVNFEAELFYGEPPEWSVPTHQDLGAVLLLANKAAEAEAVFENDLAIFPENGWSLYGLMQALQAQGKHAEYTTVERTFQRVWETADVAIEEVF